MAEQIKKGGIQNLFLWSILALLTFLVFYSVLDYSQQKEAEQNRPGYTAVSVSKHGCKSKATLRKGDTGKCVKYAQELLNYWRATPSSSYSKLKVDGVYGTKTKKAVDNFHKYLQMKRNKGVIGPKTWKALKCGCSKKVKIQ